MINISSSVELEIFHLKNYLIFFISYKINIMNKYQVLFVFHFREKKEVNLFARLVAFSKLHFLFLFKYFF